jgi:nicotinate phosphoribosyltransferase
VTSTALRTDRYELTMLDAALRDGTAERWCVFETFVRRLPHGRRYGVLAGLERVVDAIGRFRFGDDELAWLDDQQIVSAPTLDWLAGFAFAGDVHAYREGEPYLPGSPVLTVLAPFAHAVVLETVALSILNHDSAIAAAAARMVTAAGGRPLMEFGSRRAHEDAAVAAARAAYVAGFASTSNLEAGRRYGLPTAGTIAHAFVLLHDDERRAYAAQIEAVGPETTLLVDTYDIAAGVEHAIAVAPGRLGAIRIDSGDLAAEAWRARGMLDDAGLGATRIVLSGDLDEHRLAELAYAPVDGYGVGTSLVTGSGSPTAGMVYKLVAWADSPDGPWHDVAKRGGFKATVGGRKAAARRVGGDDDGELLHPWGSPTPPGARPLQVPVVVGGEVVHAPTLDDIRAHHRDALAALPADARLLTPGGPALPTRRLAAAPGG